MLRRQDEVKKVDVWKKKREEEQSLSQDTEKLIEKEWEKIVSYFGVWAILPVECHHWIPHRALTVGKDAWAL
jgi:hypothetical protein